VYAKARTLLAWRGMAFTAFHVSRLRIVDMPLQSDVAPANKYLMKSEERRIRRFNRRQKRREERLDKRIESIGKAEEVFNFHDMFRFGEDCCKGVMWKQSTQTFRRHLFSRTAVNRKRTLSGYKPRKMCRFTILERGKRREIEAPHIDDRQIQKTLTKKVLLPLYLPEMIYDNGASLKDKGLIFSQRQLDKAIRKHIKRYGMNGWIIIADFKRFFPNADRDIIRKKHGVIKDPVIRGIAEAVLSSGSGDKGLPLGVEPSQAEMIALPSPLDNYMTCQMGLRGFGHYMDDYHIFVPPDKSPDDIMEAFIRKAEECGISVSINKTRVIPFGKPFKFCKMKRSIDGQRGDAGRV